MDDMSQAIGSLTAKVEAVKERVEDAVLTINEKLDHIHQDICHRVNDHERRLRFHDRVLWSITAVTSAGAFILGKFGDFFHGK